MLVSKDNWIVCRPHLTELQMHRKTVSGRGGAVAGRKHIRVSVNNGFMEQWHGDSPF